MLAPWGRSQISRTVRFLLLELYSLRSDYTGPRVGLCRCCFNTFLTNEISTFGDQIRMETPAFANSNFLLQKKKERKKVF